MPISIVEPVIKRAQLISALSNESTVMGLTDYFDIESFNSASRKAGFGELTTREDFFKKGSRNIVYVHTGGPGNNAQINTTDSCFNLPSLHEKIKPPYCIVQMITTYGKKLSKQKIQQILGKWLKRDITLVFSQVVGSPHHNVKISVPMAPRISFVQASNY